MLAFFSTKVVYSLGEEGIEHLNIAHFPMKGGCRCYSASSSAGSSLLRKNDVFISFRGEDTRSNFTSHLHAALCRSKIKTYIDYELVKGDQISEALAKAIEDSHVSVVVFSENYASSTWCLGELTHIMNCKKQEQNNQIVVPVFYNVDPSHVRKQSVGSSYGNAFEKHVRNPKHVMKVNQWREALAEVASLAGWDSRKYK